MLGRSGKSASFHKVRSVPQRSNKSQNLIPDINTQGVFAAKTYVSALLTLEFPGLRLTRKSNRSIIMGDFVPIVGCFVV